MPKERQPAQSRRTFIEAVADDASGGLLSVELGGVARVQVRSHLQLKAVAELIGMLASAGKLC